MIPHYFELLELFIFFFSLVVVYNAFHAIELSQIFKKGHTSQIRTIYIIGVIIVAYLFARAVTNLLELSFTIFG